MKSIDYYLSLPWTITSETRMDDGRYMVLRVSELPGFVVASPKATELDTLFWDMLEEFIRSYLEDDREPPIPIGLDLSENNGDPAIEDDAHAIFWGSDRGASVGRKHPATYDSVASGERVPIGV